MLDKLREARALLPYLSEIELKDLRDDIEQELIEWESEE